MFAGYGVVHFLCVGTDKIARLKGVRTGIGQTVRNGFLQTEGCFLTQITANGNSPQGQRQGIGRLPPLPQIQNFHQPQLFKGKASLMDHQPQVSLAPRHSGHDAAEKHFRARPLKLAVQIQQQNGGCHAAGHSHSSCFPGGRPRIFSRDKQGAASPAKGCPGGQEGIRVHDVRNRPQRNFGGIQYLPPGHLVQLFHVGHVCPHRHRKRNPAVQQGVENMGIVGAGRNTERQGGQGLRHIFLTLTAGGWQGYLHTFEGTKTVPPLAPHGADPHTIPTQDRATAPVQGFFMLDAKYYANLGLSSIREKVLAGERLSHDDGLALFACKDITAVGALALHVRCRRHGHKTFYVVNRQINYTNVCVNGCTFCAFRRDSEAEPGAFSLSIEEVLDRLRAADATPLHLDELHIVGGCHPARPLAWFEAMLQKVRAFNPRLPLKAFTAVEIEHFSRLEGISTLEVLQRLQKSGLVMMPGGGAEIFDEEVRRQICPHKADAASWLRIAGEAHSLGIKTNCSMLFGHLESTEHRIDHLCRLREQQDKSGGFTCFIPLPFLTENSRLKLPEDKTGPQRGLDQLRTVAVSRLMLDNIPHIKAYWIMLAPKLAPVALWYGADDLDGTIVEEHIGHMAGAQSAQSMTIAELEHLIRSSGFVPVRRNATFVPLPDAQESRGQ